MRVSQANILRIALIAATTLCAPSAFPCQIPVGYVSWDVTFPGEAGQFDITNLSGRNAGPPHFSNHNHREPFQSQSGGGFRRWKQC